MCEYGKYVYGILDKVDNQIIENIKGIDNINSLYSLQIEDFSLVLSDVNLDQYGEGIIDKQLEDMVWVEEKAKKHFDIIQNLLQFGEVIPMKFCTIFIGNKTMLQFFDNFKQEIKDALKQLKDKEEWDIKVYCDRKRFMECNMEKEKEAMKKQLGNTSKGAAYFMAKKNESNLEEKAKEKIIKIKEMLWNDLKAYAQQVHLNKNLSKQVTECDKDMILNGAFLLNKQGKEAFFDIVDKQEAILQMHNMEIKISGPWPFYNFSGL